MQESELKEKLRTYHWYHTIKLTDNISTPGWDVPDVVTIWQMVIKALRKLNLKGKRVLDVGCRDGLFSFEAEKLGAREVIGIDNDLSRGAVEFLIPHFGSTVKMHEMNLYDLSPNTFGVFGTVCFPGVLYHLRYPFWGLRLLRDVLEDGGDLIIETAIVVDDNTRALLYCPIGPECPGEPTHCANFNLKGLIDTLYSLGITVDSVEYLWELGVTKETSVPPTHSQAVQVGPGNFDEKFYIDRYPDIKKAVAAKQFELSYYHYQHCGRSEGRIAKLLDGTVIGPDTPLVFEFTSADPLNRVVLMCRKTPEVINPHISRYLEGFHKVHTGEAGFGPVAQYPRAKPPKSITLFKGD